MFKMAKYLNSHLREDERVKAEVPDDEEGEEDEDEPVAKGKGSKKAKGKGKGKAVGGGGGGTGGGLQKELLWSEDMAAFLGTDRMSRAQVRAEDTRYYHEADATRLGRPLVVRRFLSQPNIHASAMQYNKYSR